MGDGGHNPNVLQNVNIQPVVKQESSQQPQQKEKGSWFRKAASIFQKAESQGLQLAPNPDSYEIKPPQNEAARIALDAVATLPIDEKHTQIPEQEAQQRVSIESAKADLLKPVLELHFDVTQPLRFPNGKLFYATDAHSLRQSRNLTPWEKQLLDEYDRREEYNKEPVQWPDGRKLTFYDATILLNDVKNGRKLSEQQKAVLNEFNKRNGISLITEINHAVPEPIRLTEKQQELINELRTKYPDNPLFDNDFKEVPENYVSVFCVVSERRFADLAQQGLMPQTDFINTNMPQRQSMDKVFDESAPEGYSRTNSVYAYPDMDILKNKNGLSKAEKPGNVIIEVKVDPNKVLVSDQDIYTEAQVRFREYQDTMGFDENYWEKAMTLADYNNLDDEEKEYAFYFPEVIIPGGLKQEFLRVASIIPNKEDKE